MVQDETSKALSKAASGLDVERGILVEADLQ